MIASIPPPSEELVSVKLLYKTIAPRYLSHKAKKGYCLEGEATRSLLQSRVLQAILESLKFFETA
jgi:hypothetical protein